LAVDEAIDTILSRRLGFFVTCKFLDEPFDSIDSNSKSALIDFFEKKVPLSDIIQPTEFPNLYFVTGDIRSLDSTGVRYTQKIKFVQAYQKPQRRLCAP
jgi:hypothetical protein